MNQRNIEDIKEKGGANCLCTATYPDKSLKKQTAQSSSHQYALRHALLHFVVKAIPLLLT